MKPPLFYKPARGIQRMLSIVGLLSFALIFVAPFLGILGKSLLQIAAGCLAALTISVIGKLSVHLYCSFRRYAIPAVAENVELVKLFRAESKESDEMVDKILKPNESLMWGHCVDLRKECHKQALRARLERFLEGLERLKII